MGEHNHQRLASNHVPATPQPRSCYASHLHTGPSVIRNPTIWCGRAKPPAAECWVRIINDLRGAAPCRVVVEGRVPPLQLCTKDTAMAGTVGEASGGVG